jgi:hypothetical protein
LLERGHSYTETFQIHLQLVRIAQRNGIKDILLLNGHQFALVELHAPMCPKIEVCGFVSDPQGKKDQILSYIAAHGSECISYVAMLNYLTIPRLNRLPFNMPARALREGHLANFRFIIPIASRVAPPLDSRDPTGASLEATCQRWNPQWSRRRRPIPSKIHVRQQPLSANCFGLLCFLHFLPVFCFSTAISIEPLSSSGSHMFLVRYNLDSPVPPPGSKSISIGRNAIN